MCLVPYVLGCATEAAGHKHDTERQIEKRPIQSVSGKDAKPA